MKHHFFKIIALIIVIVLACCCLVGIIIFANRDALQSPNTQPTDTPTPTITYGQKATTFLVNANFWTDAKACCSLVGYYGAWSELAKTNFGAAGSIFKNAEAKDLEPYIIISPFNQNTGKFTQTVSTETTNGYLDTSEQFVKLYHPHYFGIGVEINLLYDKSPDDYQKFLEMYRLAYARIKAAAPNTQVFPVFQYEQLKGLRGGLFGGKNDTSKNNWKLLADFKDYSDMTGFTTYPGIIYGKPADIPIEYYNQISQYTDKPVVFTEVGWFTTGVKGWESNEAEQADFVTKYFALQSNLPVVFSSWALLYDVPNQSIFSTMGLIDEKGHQKSAYLVWQDQ